MDVYRGDIFYIQNRDYYNVGSEQQSGRPAIIVSNDIGNEYAPVVSVVYLTTQEKKPLPTHVKLLCKQMSTALCEQISTVSKERLGDYIRTATAEEMREIDTALAVAVGISTLPVEGQNEDYKKAIADRDAHITMLQKQLLEKEEEVEYINHDISSTHDMQITVERDLYKNLYEQLLDRMTAR